MMLKVLKICLFLVLIVSFFGFGLKVDNQKDDAKKVDLIKSLTKDNTFAKRMPKRALDLSAVTNAREPVTADARVATMSELDAQRELEDAYDKMGYAGLLMTGNVVGSSNLDYAIAYFARSIEMGPDAVLHAVWCTAGDPSNETLYSRSTDHGETWSAPIEVHDGYYGYKPGCTVDPNNGDIVYVTYTGYQNEGEIRSVRVSKSVDGGLSFGASIPVFGSNQNCNNSDVVVDHEGNVHVVFDSYEDEHQRYNYSGDGGATYWDEPEILTVGLTTVDTFGPTVSVDEMNNPHIGFAEGSTGWNVCNCMTNWRDMATGTWMNVPPAVHINDLSATAVTSFVFDSDGVTGHFFYDGGGGTQGRSVWYRSMTYDAGLNSWDFGTAEEFVLSSEAGGSTYWPVAAIDQDDNLFLAYQDNLGVGGIGSDGGDSDVFTGTNISGAWEFTNFTADGVSGIQKYLNANRYVVDTTFHILYMNSDNDILHDQGYPWPPNPTCGVNQLPDTYNLTGPFTVNAGTGDIDGVVVSCSLYVWQNGTLIVSGLMTELATNSYTYDFTVTGAVGDEIEYRGVATDDDGLSGGSFILDFDIMEPANPCADILLVGDQMQLLDMFDQVISDLGYVYEYWDVDAHNGIDASVTMWGWNNIIAAGWGVTSIPTRAYAADQPYVLFMEDGGNLALMDMDYFWRNGEEGNVDLTFDPGDFAYDYLNVGGGVSDPLEVDDVLMGVDGDAISGNFAEAPFLQFFPDLVAIDNYVDWAYTGSADDIFYALTLGYECGVKNDAGSYKTVFLPFMFEWLAEQDGENVVPNADAYTLMGNILTWFEAGSPPLLSGATGPRYGVYGTGPFDVYAEASDPVLAKTAAALVSVEVGYMTDDMSDYAWVEMTDNGDGSFSGQIPELAVGDTTYWKIRASDEGGCPAQTAPTEFWVTGLEATEGVEVLYCDFDPYDWYYACSLDSSVGARTRRALDATTYAWDFWDVDVYGTPDYQTVLSNYKKVIWQGFAEWDPVFPPRTVDNPFAEFIMNGGRFLCSSDELLGVASTYVQNDFTGPWFDVDFTSGWAAFDVLGAAHVYNDYNYADMIIAFPSHPMFAQMDLAAIDSVFTLDFCFNEGIDWSFGDYIEYAGEYCTMWADDNAGSVYYANSTRVDRLGADTEAKVVFFPWQLGAVPGLDLRAAFLEGILDWFNLENSTDKKVGTDIPESFALHNNYPNPFNPETSIAYDIPKASKVELAIYNVMGQKIRTLISESKSAGRYMATWNGQNDFGVQVATGVYFYRITAGDFVKTHKMMLVK